MSLRSKALCVLAVAGISTSFAGGHYDVSYSAPTGKVVILDGLGRTEIPYGPMDGWFGGKGVVRTAAGSVTCSGPIIATMSWNNEGDPNNLPPEAVVVAKTGYAKWGGDRGACDDGFGSPDVSHVRTGTYYQLISKPGTTFQVTISPNATGPVDGSGGGVDGLSANQSPNGGITTNIITVNGGYAEARVNVAVSEIRIQIEGPIVHEAVTKALIGQRLLWTISKPNHVSLSNYQWSLVPPPNGSFGPLSSFQASWWYLPTEHRYIQPPANAATQPFYLLTFGSPGEITVSCQVNVYVNNSLLGTASLNRPMRILAPYYYMNYNVGEVGYVPSATNADEVKAMNAAGDPSIGIRFVSRVGTPYPFWSVQGNGQFNFAQTLNFKARRTYVGGADVINESGYQDLDNTFPYESVWVRADHLQKLALSPPQSGWEYEVSDAPGVTLENGTIYHTASYTLNLQFWMMLIYDPPLPLGSGYGTEIVPLHVIEWKVNATDNRGTAATWPTVPPGTVTKVNDWEFPTPMLQWSNVFYNVP